jgi:hypothetical protein
MSYYDYIKRRIRHSGVTRLTLEALAKAGINLRPFVLFRESDSTVELNPDPGSSNIEIRYIDRNDLHLFSPFSQVPGRDIPKSSLLARLEAGNRCIALFLDGELATFSWYELDRCSFDGYPFRLRDNEAYLFDTYTPVPFRGKGLAPRVRQFMYRELANDGRNVIYSFSDRLNRPAIRFKEKLLTKRIVTGYYLVLFSRWKFTFGISKIDPDAPSYEAGLRSR